MESLWTELRFSFRTLGRNLGFTVVAVVTLGLGLGATSSILAVINAVLLSALPFDDPDRIALIHGTLRQEGGVEELPVSYRDFVDFQERTEVFEEMAIYSRQTFNLVAGGEAEVVVGELASAGYFDLLGVGPVRGRVYTPEEDSVPGAHPLAVVSHDLWQRRFGEDPGLIGSTLTLSGNSYQVLGVMPPGFRGLTDEADVWVPMMMTQKVLGGHYLELRGFRVFSAAGRLAPGVSLEGAQAALERLARDLERQYPVLNENHGVRLEPLREAWFGELRPALLTILGAAGFVLLIACAGVACLLLVRATARQREMAIRSAMGASRGQLVRQLLTESAVLALLGGALGLLLAHWSTGLLVAASGVDFKTFVHVAVDPLVVAAMVLLALVSAGVAGLVPAWISSRVDLATTLKEGSKGSAGAGRHRLQAALVVAEVALALVLLVGAGLMARGFQKHRDADLGFRTGVLTLRLDVREERFRGWPVLDFFALARQMVERVGLAPGVRSVVLEGPGLPTDRWSIGYFNVEQSPDRLVEDVVFLYHHVTPGYFELLDVPLLEGRTFTFDDKHNLDKHNPETPFAVVVSESLARRFWPGGSALGKRIKETSNSPWLEIVGVVADVEHAGLRKESAPGHHIYLPLLQFPPREPATFNLLVRPEGGDPASLEPLLREEVRKVDPGLPPYDVKTIERRLDDQAASDRFLVLLMALFALLALTLATTGIYGVIAYLARQREREIGIRMALGARRRDVLRLVVGQGVRMALAGVAVGVVATVVVIRLVRSFLYDVRVYGVQTIDPLVLAGTALLLLAVVALASYVPARRSARIEPSRVLRIE